MISEKAEPLRRIKFWEIIFKLRMTGKFTIPLLTWSFSCLFDNCVKSVDYEYITFRIIVNRLNISVSFWRLQRYCSHITFYNLSLSIIREWADPITIIFWIFEIRNEYITAMISPQLTYSLFGDHLILWEFNSFNCPSLLPSGNLCWKGALLALLW